MNERLRREIGLGYVLDARLMLGYARLEGVTESELEKMREQYKITRDGAIRLGIDVQRKQLPRTIKEKNLLYLIK